MTEWCSCMDQFKNATDSIKSEQSIWKFCPICGTPRPAKPKRLAELLRDAHAFYHDKNSPIYLRQEDAAIKWFIELVDSMPKYGGSGFIDRDEIKAALLEGREEKP